MDGDKNRRHDWKIFPLGMISLELWSGSGLMRLLGAQSVLNLSRKMPTVIANGLRFFIIRKS